MKDLYKRFINEAEMFFVKKFITSPTIEKTFTFCLDVIYNFNNDPEVDYNRGIIAFNKKYGVGKSFFFDVVHHLHFRIRNQYIFKKTSAKELVNVFKEKGEAELLEFIKVKNLFIDDIGDEGDDKFFSHYNNKMNVIRFVLLKRYEWWVSKGFRTFGTTNLTIEEIAKNYDGRVADRFMQMVYFEHFDFLETGSFRQIKSTRKLTQQEIQENWKKLEKPKVEEKIDVVAFMNDLLIESDDYLQNMGEVAWSFVKKFMLEKEYLKTTDFDEIDDAMFDAARSLEKKQIRESISVLMKNCIPVVRENKREEKYKEITRDSTMNIAQNVITKRKFLELRNDKNFKFKSNG
ncbi:hypothetical protein [Flavobacterium phage FPSV-S2]|nr:hypothetical protein [Flavobacterium phage FPSV-S2]